MKGILRLKVEVWCIDLALVDKLAKNNNSVKCFLVRQDSFDGTVDAEVSKETVGAFSTMIRKKNRRKKEWVDKKTEFSGEFLKNVKLKECKITLQRVRPRLHLLNV